MLLPSLPPHSSPRSGGSTSARLASFSLMPSDPSSNAGWLNCSKGANTLPLPLRKQSESSPAAQQLHDLAGAARQLTTLLTRLVANGGTARDGASEICAISAYAVGAEAAALVALSSNLAIEACLAEHNFTRACDATLRAAPPCNRLVTALPHELRDAAERCRSLNMSGAATRAGARPAASEVGRVAIREPPSARGALVQQVAEPISSALVIPVTDPITGTAVALLVCCNGRNGRFTLSDELLAECAALHVGLLWLHHVQVLRLAPLPGALLPAPDSSGARLRVHWSALVAARARQRELLAEAAVAMACVGGGEATVPPSQALRPACRRMLRARVMELRHTMLAAAATAPARGVEPVLDDISQQWVEVLLAEVRGEMTRLGGAGAAARVVEALEGPMQRAAQQAARHYSSSLKPRTASSSDGAHLEDDNGASEATSREAPMIETIERLVIQASLQTAAPFLLRLPPLIESRTPGLRMRLATTLNEEATWVAQENAITAGFLSGEPPVLEPWLEQWRTSSLDDVHEHAQDSGEETAKAAGPALSTLMSLHEARLRDELGAQLQGASLLFHSFLEQQYCRIAQWVDASLKGRLVYRETMLETMRAATPRWMRQLLAGTVQCHTPVHRRFEGRVAAAATAAAGGEIKRAEPPDFAVPTLTGVAEGVVGELIKVAGKALDPLAKQFGTVVAQTRPRIIKLRPSLREELLSLLAACVVHPRQVLISARAVVQAANSVQAAMLTLEPKLAPLRSEKVDQAVPTAELPQTMRQGVKEAMIGEMPQLVPNLAAIVATLAHTSEAMEAHAQRHLTGWTERCYAKLLTALTDVAGPRAAEVAMPRVADMLPASAQQVVRDLHREARLAQEHELALCSRLLEAEAHVARCIARPIAEEHIPGAVGRFLAEIGASLRGEIDAIIQAEASAIGPDADDADDADELADGGAAAASAEAAAFFAEEQRHGLYQRMCQIFARPVVEVLESAVLRAIESGDWHFPRSISTSVIACVKSWVSAVHTRIGRRFLHGASSTDAALLEFAQTMLPQAAEMAGPPCVQQSEMPLVEDQLIVATERVLDTLPQALAKLEEYTPAPALSVLLHHERNVLESADTSTPHGSAGDALLGSAPANVRPLFAYGCMRPGLCHNVTSCRRRLASLLASSFVSQPLDTPRAPHRRSHPCAARCVLPPGALVGLAAATARLPH